MSSSSYRIVVRGLVLPFRIGVYERDQARDARALDDPAVASATG